MTGRALATVSVTAAEVPPPGAGSVTVTGSVAAVAASAAVTEKLRLVLDATEAGRETPLTETVAPAAKLEPVRVTVVEEAVPAVMVEGARTAAVGSGLATVRLAGREVPPPGAGSVTKTVRVPADTCSAGETGKLRLAGLAMVAARAVPLTETVAPETKPLPVRVTTVGDAVPAVMVAGAAAVMTGRGLAMDSEAADEVPPPGAGFCTVTGRMPPPAESAATVVKDSWVWLTTVVVRAVPLT